MCYETDTDLLLTYNGSSWVALRTSSGAVVTGSASGQNVLLTISNTATNGYSTLALGTDNAAGIYRLGSATTSYAGVNSLMLGTVNADPVAIITGNTVRMNVDGNGRVTMPSQPAFKAHVLTSGGTVSTANGSLIPLQYTSLNIGSCFNTSNYRFTAPVAGTYIFGGELRIDVDQAYVHTLPFVNGSQSRQNDELPGLNSGNSGLGFTAGAFSYLRYLNTNDYIQFSIHWNSGGPYGVQSQTYVFGYLLG